MILRQWKEGAAFTQGGDREKYVDYETQRLTRVLFFFFRLCPRGNLASPEKKSGAKVVSIIGVS
jgi:hypothetical protein